MSRIDRQAKSPVEQLRVKGMKKSKPSGSAGTGGPTHAHPPAEPLLKPKAKEDKDQTDEEDVENEDLKAPVGLLIKFLRALKDKDLQLAVKLCQMILIYEPDNPEASEFLPLIQKKLLEEQDTESSTEEDDEEESDDDDDDTDSGSDDDDGEKENQDNRHKPCPPAHISP
ncbi:glutamate-rich protein 2-like isoform X2 [Archocentrus centrarchus]|uniref:glutamate-rich protein 2-like isoform X2 n=1 Tax=Archocentrus centrarchus TaxID=63155 RepID=UPI0011EA164F|nr:glutamate-rich protein 2-like isoform X2 [Archocentrus centrarchus]